MGLDPSPVHMRPSEPEPPPPLCGRHRWMAPKLCVSAHAQRSREECTQESSERTEKKYAQKGLLRVVP